MRPSLLSAPIVLSLVSGALCAPTPEEIPNEPPVARLLSPQLWDVDDPVPFDASTSSDVDGRLIRITAIFGDGTPEETDESGVFAHLYGDPASYEVRVEVEDGDGEVAAVHATVVIVNEMLDPVCSCDFPCQDDATCAETGCYLAGSSDDSVPPVPEDVIPCEA
jgi:hypothetical protein